MINKIIDILIIIPCCNYAQQNLNMRPKEAMKNKDAISSTDVGLELKSFTAKVNGFNVELNWTTNTEKNNEGFEIERTSLQPFNFQGEGGETWRGWEKIGFVHTSGKPNKLLSYSFMDENVSPGIYRYRLKQIDSDETFLYSQEIEAEILSLLEFVVNQNYPNPFNPVTIIRFQILKSGIVSLRVYDTLGSVVATLLNENKEKGSYEIQFDASTLPSGIYFYRLSTNRLVDVRKMVLLK